MMLKNENDMRKKEGNQEKPASGEWFYYKSVIQCIFISVQRLHFIHLSYNI